MRRFVPLIGIVMATMGLLTPVAAQAAPVSPTAKLTTDVDVARVTNAYGYRLAAGPRLRALTHARYEFMGSLMNGGRLGYCVDYALQLGADQPWRQVRVGTAQWNMIAYILNGWGNTHSPTQAAAVNDAINRTTGNRNYALDRPYYLAQLNRHDPRVVQLSNYYVSSARLYHGPYRASVQSTRVLVGQRGQAVISVVAATRRGVPSAPVRLGYSGAVGPASGRTAANGRLTVAFTRTSINPVTIGATATLVQSSALIISMPRRGFQRLVAVSTVPRVAVKAHTTWQLGPTGPVVRGADCTSNCQGHPPVTMTFTNAQGTATTQYFPVRSGRVDSRYSVTLAGGRTGSLRFIADNDETVGWAYRVYYGGRWSAVVVATNRLFVVDCPPLPALHIVDDCPCAGGGATTFSIPRNTDGHAQAILINGVRVATANPGQAASKTITITRRIVVEVAAQRSNGQWLKKRVRAMSP